MRRVPLLLLLATGCPQYIEAESASSNGLETDSTSDTDATGTTAGSSSSTGGSTSTGATTSTSTTDATASTTSSSTTDTSTTASTTGDGCDGPCVPDDAPDGLSCKDDCAFDFSAVPQWYCSGGCSPVGDAVGGMSCDQPDADLFCALLTGNPDATAEKWSVNAVIDAPGFCCLDLFPELSLGALAEYGVDDLCYMGVSMIDTHANGSAILAEDITCVVP